MSGLPFVKGTSEAERARSQLAALAEERRSVQVRATRAGAGAGLFDARLAAIDREVERARGLVDSTAA